MNTQTSSNSPADPMRALAGEYPTRGAAEVLGQRVSNLLREGAYGVGDRFLTDDELVQATGLSRSTVRRALAHLKADGWLDRRAGRGTYVGQIQERSRAMSGQHSASTRTIRLGVLAFVENDPVGDWLTPQVLQGINQTAAGYPLRVELMPGFSGRVADVARRLDKDRPDVIVSLSDSPSDAVLLRLASEQGIRCMIIGTRFPELDLPRVCEDNRGGMDMAVRRLAEMGHQRIGLMMRRWVGSWLLKRHEQWHDTLATLGLAHDEGLVHWLPMGDQDLNSAEAIAGVQRWIDEAQPSVILGAHYSPAQHLGHLIREGRLRVPDDVSVVLIDRHPAIERMMGTRPTCVELPIREMGEKVVELAVAWCAGEAPPSLTKLPMRWSPGLTLAPSS